jgi:hypothetical protein
MLKELVKVANRLDSLGLQKEATILDRLIQKMAGVNVVENKRFNPETARSRVRPTEEELEEFYSTFYENDSPEEAMIEELERRQESGERIFRKRPSSPFGKSASEKDYDEMLLENLYNRLDQLESDMDFAAKIGSEKMMDDIADKIAKVKGSINRLRNKGE